MKTLEIEKRVKREKYPNGTEYGVSRVKRAPGQGELRQGLGRGKTTEKKGT